MRGERQLKRDYDAIHYIQRQLSGFEDKKMVFAMTKAFNKMCAAEEPDGCLSTTVELFIAEISWLQASYLLRAGRASKRL